MNRRDLIHKIVVGGTTLLVAPGLFSDCSKPYDKTPPLPAGRIPYQLKIDLSNPFYDALMRPGGSMILQGLIIANLGDKFVALDSRCTHAGCVVEYQRNENNFKCTCHEAHFAVTGAVISGPADKPLLSHSIIRDGDILTISLI